jgi:hypothetical protein
MAPRKRQLNVGLDDETRAWLEEAAAQTGRTLAEEIRHRLQLTFWEDREFDPPTRQFGKDIMRLATEVEATSAGMGYWYEHQRTHAAVAAAVAAWLELIKPPRSDDDDLLDGTAEGALDDPETLGRTIARLRFRTRHVREEIASYTQARRDKYAKAAAQKKGKS